MPGWNWQKIKEKQHLETELLLFEKYLFFWTKLLSKNSRKNSKTQTKKQSACVLMRLSITMKIRLKMKKRSHICNKNGSRPRHGHKYT